MKEKQKEGKRAYITFDKLYVEGELMSTSIPNA